MINNYFNIPEKLRILDEEVMKTVAAQFAEIDTIAEANQQKMLAAFIENGVGASSFSGSTGYGLDDRGRDMLDRVAASVFGTEAALMRMNFVSGTHALTVALFGILRPNDTMLCVTGRPYDTLLGVLGINGQSSGSLKEFGVGYDEVALLSDGRVDCEGIAAKLRENKHKIVYVQRSRGYSLRPSLTVDEIKKIVLTVKAIAPDTPVVVDNCYGEFTDIVEPTDIGADLIIGSMIKNVGGGIAPTGGYIAGKAKLVEQCAYRMTSPGTGAELGATLGHTRELMMGFFNAPHLTGEALKLAVYAAALLEKLGYDVTPRYNEKRGDIVQSLILGDAERLIKFCRGIQRGMPIDSYLRPDPSPMPGYDSEVIMAAGGFTLGATGELSADAPLREPYAVWMQGALNFHSAKIGVLIAVAAMEE